LNPLNANRKTKGERGLWQRRFWKHLIRDDDDYEHHIVTSTITPSNTALYHASPIGSYKYSPIQQTKYNRQ